MSTLFMHCSIQAPVYPGLEAVLRELEGPKVLVAPATMVAADPTVANLFDEVVSIPGGFGEFLNNADVELEAFRMHAKHPFTRVVTTGEVGVLRAARFRAAIGVPGQSVASAVAYRDKVLMKAFCAKAGIPVAQHAEIDSPADLVGFARRVGFPIVLKPRAGAGSIDTKLLRNEAEMWAVLKSTPASTVFLGMGLLAEKFVNGQLYHVNGYATGDQRVGLSWPASYMERGNLFAVIEEGTVSGEYLLEATDPRIGAMQAFTEKCLRALPWPAHGFAFHLELFEEEGAGELVLCEVACRQGGGAIVDVYNHGFGVDLLDASIRLQAGLAVPQHPTTPNKICAGVSAPVRRGILQLSTTDLAPFPWVLKQELKLRSGDRGLGPRSCVDESARFVFEAATTAEVKSRLTELMRWRNSVATWLPEPQDDSQAG